MNDPNIDETVDILLSILDNICYHACGIERGKSLHCDYCRENFAIKDAINAMQKKKPMRPVLVAGYPKAFFICGCCGSTFIERGGVEMKYCNNCGQSVQFDLSGEYEIKRTDNDT